MTVCNMSLQVIPLCRPAELYEVVDRVIEMIAACGMNYVVGPMETTVEGEMEELLALVLKAREICERSGVKRMCFVVKFDYSTEGVTIDEKMEKYSR